METSNFFDTSRGDAFLRDEFKILLNKKKKQLPINSIVEEELRETLDKIWENRLQLTSDFNLKQLRSFTNKSKVVFK